jgi:hypothetical protein
LYAFAISAAGTGSPWFGALVMAAFWLGTVPALFGVGVLAGRLLSPLKRHAPLLSAALLVTVGLSAIFQRSNIPVEAFNQVRGALAGDNTTAPKAPACH